MVLNGAMVRRSALAWVTMATVGSLALAGCGRSGFQYLESDDHAAFAKIPDDWTVVSEGYVDFMLRNQQDGQIMMLPGDERLAWQTRFTSDPRGEFADDVVTGGFEVQPVDARIAPSFDLEQFAEYAPEGVDVLESRRVRVDDLTGYRVDLASDEGDYLHTRLVLTDSRTTVIYVVELGCAADCYQANDDVIDEIVETFTVKD